MPIFCHEGRPDIPGATRVYSDADLYDLLWGLGLGGSGGGGGYKIGDALVKAIIAEIPIQRRVLYSVSSAADSDFAVMAGGIGAPSAITTKTITNFADYCMAAIDAYSKEQKKTVNALLPVEAGPVNALLALYLGWKNGLKVFDCDGDGRAVPSLTNLVFGYNGYPIAPLYLAGKKHGEDKISAAEVTPAPKDAAAAEGAIRDNLGTYDRAAGLVCWGQTGAQMKASKYLIRDQFEALRDLGAKCRACASDPVQLFDTLRSSSMVEDVISAKLISVNQEEQAGYDVDNLVFFKNYRYWFIKALNENMLMWSRIIIGAEGDVDDGTTITTAPNGIAPIFDVGGKGTYVPLNNGDDLRTADVVGHPALIVTLKERCMLFDGAIGTSFEKILRGQPFNYSGPITPTKCIP